MDKTRIKNDEAINSLDVFCDANNLDKDEIIEKLTTAGFEYDEEKKRFW